LGPHLVSGINRSGDQPTKQTHPLGGACGLHIPCRHDGVLTRRRKHMRGVRVPCKPRSYLKLKSDKKARASKPQVSPSPRQQLSGHNEHDVWIAKQQQSDKCQQKRENCGCPCPNEVCALYRLRDNRRLGCGNARDRNDSTLTCQFCWRLCQKWDSHGLGRWADRRRPLIVTKTKPPLIKPCAIFANARFSWQSGPEPREADHFFKTVGSAAASWNNVWPPSVRLPRFCKIWSPKPRNMVTTVPSTVCSRALAA
jgi:hypothetical protein